ncbi:hypothetical protein [Vibrio cholerae]|uniref:Uncharacterized protein n=1 Tax=Vibrio cholerae TaxID=666 RepID=A0ABD7SRM2_VIBCL|nr:hypothetical protein [Vibrio cholerae]TXX67430.1 hypothetical protein FXF03_02285 [Vibrio cholerae]GIB00088.1 hypothetical protein VCSRO136_2511 [Vibrio cholerae]
MDFGHVSNILDGHDASVVNELIEGVLDRLKVVIQNGNKLDEDLILSATQHYFLSRKKYYDELLTNQNGQFDLLVSKVKATLEGK